MSRPKDIEGYGYISVEELVDFIGDDKSLTVNVRESDIDGLHIGSGEKVSPKFGRVINFDLFVSEEQRDRLINIVEDRIEPRRVKDE